MTLPLLLVEDDDVFREELGSALGFLGFEVVSACDGLEAMTVLETAKAMRFHAMVTDIRLGNGPDGWEVADRARQLIPDMRIVYMSGDSIAIWPEKGVPNSHKLVKPFPMAAMLKGLSVSV